MSTYLPESYVLVITLILLQDSAQNCPDGWFGEECSLKCLCLQSTTCESTGQCANNGPCKVGYFGPGCQYVDLAQFQMFNSGTNYFTDGDETTCNPHSDATYVELILRILVPFSWFRIHVNDSANLLNFNTTLNSGQSCTRERKFVVSEKVVDVTCDRDIRIRILRIEGPIVRSICSIYISRGRNVALKQQANQSSQFDLDDLDKYKAENAVDGDSNNSVEAGHCSQTSLETGFPEWQLSFSRPQLVYSANVYNANRYKNRLLGFTLETFDAGGNSTSYYQESSDLIKDNYEVFMSSKIPASSLKIAMAIGKPYDHRMLTLCEVEVLGDVVCPMGTYGLFCEGQCECSKSEVCNAITGVCAPACQPGFYGYTCSSRCGENCLNEICEWLSGNCLQCPPGYKGDMCNTECDPGTFGQDCRFTCPVHCSYNCSYTNGLCTSCPHDFYGPNCEHQCSVNCENQTCDPQTGNCTQCQDGFYGDLCLDVCDNGTFGPSCEVQCASACRNVCNHVSGQCLSCPLNHYGPVCELNCSKNCLDEICDRWSGYCSSCLEGYTGDFCEDDAIDTWKYLLPVLPAYIFFCIILQFFVKRPPKPVQDEENE